MSDQKTEQNIMCMLMNYNYIIIIIIMQNRKEDFLNYYYLESISVNA